MDSMPLAKIGLPIIIAIVILLLIIMIWLNASRPGSENNSSTDPNFPDLGFLGHLQEGNNQATQGNLQEALRHFEAALVLSPLDVSLHFKIGRLYSQLENWDKAIKAFRVALKHNPNLVDGHYELARIAQFREDYPLAKEHINQALALESENEACLKLKLKILNKQDDKTEQLSVLTQLSKVSPNAKKYRVAWANTAAQIGLYEEATKAYQELSQEFPEEELNFQEKIAELYIEQSMDDSAIDLLRKNWATLESKFPSLSSRDDNPAPLNPEAEAAKTRIGSMLSKALSTVAQKILTEDETSHTENNHTTTALSNLQEALRYNPKNADIHCKLGKIHLKQGDTNNAFAAFQEALSLDPVNLYALEASATIEEARARYDEAIEFYNRYILLNDQSQQVHFSLGTLYGIQNKLDLSIQHLRKAIKFDPLFVEAHYNLAVALEQKQDYNAATKTYKKVLQLDPTHEKARSNLAFLRHEGRGA